LKRKTLPDSLVRGLAEECEKLRKGLVIGCDANAHHTQWGCPSNDRGESLLDFILNSNLFLCNRGNVTTFITKTCQTIIDLTLESDSLVGAVKNWAVSDEHSFLDHRFIETVLSLDSPLPVSFANTRRADWHRYKEVLTNILPLQPSESITNPQELDGTVNKFTGACNTAFKVACPTGKSKGRKKPPWWTQQISILRTNCRCLFNRAKAGNEDTNWQNYKYELAYYKNAIRRAKRTALT